ncbi:MAG TPA: ribonuclease H-like domain-containing protein [bacterium]|nr:ribonuclease H-like domain-containing protein [bacterium]
MCPPEPALPTTAPDSVRERLRRLGVGGAGRVPAPPATTSRAPAPIASVARPAPVGDGVEVVRATFGRGHRHGRCVLGDTLRTLADVDDLAHTVWLDTETTGLAGGTGTYAFLVGLAYLDDDRLVIEQLLLRRLSAERHLLAALAERLGRARRLVTFNGQRFDWPIIEARFVLARQQPAAFVVHTDLIHPARRLWHRVLGTHRLSALEAEVLGAPRYDDVPGWEIPGIYVRYLRDTDRSALNPILVHNRSDLLALVLLHGEVARILRSPHDAGVPLDWEGTGVLVGRRGAHATAIECFERALDATDRPGDRWRVLQKVTRAHRAAGDADAARRRWETEAATWTEPDRLRAHVLEEVAKTRTKRGDLAGALAATREALSIAESFPAGIRGLLGKDPAALSRLADRLRVRLVRLGERDG